MSYRTDDIAVSTANPFEHDALDRKPLVKFLSNLIVKLTGPFVMAIDGPWGSGKTTLMHMLKAQLESDKFQCIEFNAWKVDYVADPLLPLMAEIDKALNFGEDEKEILRKDNWGKAKKITGLIAKRFFVGAVKAGTASVVDLDEYMKDIATEFTGGAAEDIVTAFQKETELLEQLRNALKEAVEGLVSRGKKPNLIFFIDELDRCRPDFAIELLERVKHIFDVKNIIFVLLIDKQQLEASTKAIYGAGTNATEYLRRFIDLEYGLRTLENESPSEKLSGSPTDKSVNYTENLMRRFKIDEILKKQIDHVLQDERKSINEQAAFINFFSFLGNAFALSLRARERCMTRLQAVLAQQSSNELFDVVVVAFLVILRTQKLEKFNRITQGYDAPESAIDSLLIELKNLNVKPDSIIGRLQIYLILSDFNEMRRNQRVKELWPSDRITSICSTVDVRPAYNGSSRKIKYLNKSKNELDQEFKKIAKAVDLSANFD